MTRPPPPSPIPFCTVALIERPLYLNLKFYVHVQPNYTTNVINYLNGVYHVHVKQYKQIDLCV